MNPAESNAEIALIMLPFLTRKVLPCATVSRMVQAMVALRKFLVSDIQRITSLHLSMRKPFFVTL
jgi:hypothetical protein